MNLYTQIKASVPIKDAARRYGLTVSKSGMTLCPFHHDIHPSMKLNEDYFFCFGCGATGDVIDFTARLFDLSPKEAVQKLTADFGLDPPPPAQQQNIPNPYAEQPQNMERLCIFLLSDYLRLLRIWRLRYAPKSPRDSFHPRFVEACQMTAHVDYLLDCLFSSIREERRYAVGILTEREGIYRFRNYVNRRKKEEEIIVQRKYAHSA